MKSFEDVFVIYYSAADYDPTFKLFTAHYHKIRTWSSRSPTAPLSGRCSKLPRAGVILPQIIPQGMWGPEYVKIEII